MLKMHKDASAVLKNLKAILNEIDQEIYTAKVELLSGSSIGQHVRHIIESYQCLLSSLDLGVVNYCLRNRDHKLETNLDQVRRANDTVLIELTNLNDNPTLRLEKDLEGTSFVTTNLDRELLHCMEHAVHHMALIKIGLKMVAPEIMIPAHFGVADSTLRHRARMTNAN